MQWLKRFFRKIGDLIAKAEANFDKDCHRLEEAGFNVKKILTRIR